MSFLDAKKIHLIGITGTNGKTTTCLMIYQILKMLKQNVAYMGTVGFYYGDVKKPMVNTTPTIFNCLFNIIMTISNNIWDSYKCISRLYFS